jgi:hypothetical protein
METQGADENHQQYEPKNSPHFQVNLTTMIRMRQENRDAYREARGFAEC